MSVSNVSFGLRKGRIFIFPTYSPGRGTYIFKPPVHKTTPDQAELIGEFSRRALQQFVDGGQMPGPDDELRDVLDGIGLATWDEYHRGLKSCSLKQYPDHYLIRGDKGPREVPLTMSDEELGRAILQALGAARRYWR